MKYIAELSKFTAVSVSIICLTLFSQIDLAAEVKILDPQYEMIRLTKDTPFADCNGAVIGAADGALYVVQTGNGMFARIALTMVDGKLYVAEIAAGRISKVDAATGNKVVFLVGITGKPNAIGNDGSGNLIILDGASQKLFKLNTKNSEALRFYVFFQRIKGFRRPQEV